MEDLFLTSLLALPVVEEAQLSPDCRWVAFTWERASANVDVYVVPCDGSAPPVALSATHEATHLIGWSRDSRFIVIGEDHDGDERMRLLRVAIDAPGVLEPLTEEYPPYYLAGGALSPDNRTLYYSLNYEIATGEITEHSVIYRHDLSTGERAPISRSRRGSGAEPQLNHAGTHLLHQRVDGAPGGEQLILVDCEGGEERDLAPVAPGRKASGAWLPDGRRVVVVTESDDAAYQRVGVSDIVSGATRLLLDDPTRQVETAWPTEDGLVIIDEVRGGRHLPVAIDPTTGAEVALPQLAGGNMLPLGRAADGAWIARHYTATTPHDLVRIEGEGEDLRVSSLTRVTERTRLDLTSLTPAESFNWASDDGLPIHGWLYRAAPPTERAVLYIHGGPTWHSEEWLNAEIQYLVRRGFTVLDVNYRGSTGYGMAFREAIKIDGWGGREQADIAAAARALITTGLAAPGRIGVTGTSYGGYSAWWQIVHTPPAVIAAAAPICGMTDLVIDYETTRPDLRPYSEEMMGGAPAEAPERYRERSPIHFVEQIRGALLIVQGAQDPNVTPENVRQVRVRLDAAGVPYELLEFADEGHGIHRPANQAVLYRRLAEFFERTLN